MNPKALLAHFDRVTDAPDAIPRLRRFILDLAMRGKLVAQDPRDQPASELLREIQADRHRSSRNLTMTSESLPAVSRSEIPYQLPHGWEWAPLGILGETNIGLTYSPQDVSARGIPVLRSNNIRDGKLLLSELVRVKTDIKQTCLVNEGDLLICARNGSRALVGKAAIISGLQEKTAFGAFMAVFRSRLNSYIYQFLCSPLFRLMIDEVNTTTINQITQTNLRSTLAPIPPLSEQRRIVEKVSELMMLCDRLEAAQSEREACRDRAAAASHYFLSNCRDREALQSHAEFYLNHLPDLTVRLDHIKQLRETILDFAIRGRLVPQDPKDEPASKLLRRIEEEKMTMARAGKIRLRNPPVAVIEKPFLIPATWAWTRLGTLCFLITDGAHHTPTYEEEGVPFLSVKDVSGGTIDFSNTRLISKTTHRELCKRCRPEFGDILLTKVGTTGIAVTVDVETQFSIFVSLALLKFSNSNLNRFYLKYLINSPFVRRQSAENTQGIGNKNLVLRFINQFAVPIPPLSEQQRIVAKIEELMALCDRLERQLTAAQSASYRLLESVLHHALHDVTPEVKAICEMAVRA